jgi:hypothetical protein
MDAATCPEEPAAKPSVDDLSVCIKCGELLVFQDDLTLRPMELNDMLSLDEATKNELLKVQSIIRKLRME